MSFPSEEAWIGKLEQFTEGEATFNVAQIWRQADTVPHTFAVEIKIYPDAPDVVLDLRCSCECMPATELIDIPESRITPSWYWQVSHKSFETDQEQDS